VEAAAAATVSTSPAVAIVRDFNQLNKEAKDREIEAAFGGDILAYSAV
jgi:hypothetical protein